MNASLKNILLKPITPILFSFFLGFCVLASLYHNIVTYKNINSHAKAKFTPPVKSVRHKVQTDIALSLFGNYVPENLADMNLRPTMANLKLVGLILADNPDDSGVIISSGKIVKTYHINDKIPGGFLLKKIVKGGVVLERDGSLELLPLPKSSLPFTKPSRLKFQR